MAAAARKLIVYQRGPNASSVASMSPAGAASEDIAWARIEDEDHVEADCDEGEKLDDRLDCNGGHYAMVAFIRIDIPGAEKDGEEREPCGDEERGAGLIGIGSCGAKRQRVEADRDRLQLQRDIGGGGGYGDERHDRGEPVRFAEP